MASSSISVGIRWNIEDGDGGKCLFCSDARFGKQARLILEIGGRDCPQLESLCLSCADAVIHQYLNSKRQYEGS